MVKRFNPYWLPVIGGVIVFGILIYLLLNESFSWEEEVVTLGEEKQEVRFEAVFPTDVHSLEDLDLTFHLANNNSFPITLSQPVKFKLMDENGKTLMEDILDIKTETINYNGGFEISIPSPFGDKVYHSGNYILRISLPKVLVQEQEIDFNLKETNIRVKTTVEEVFG